MVCNFCFCGYFVCHYWIFLRAPAGAVEASFLGCQLLDFDDYVGANRTGELLLSFQDNAILLGSAHTEQFDLDDVAYVYVVPRRQRVKLNVKSCVEIKFRTPHAIDAMSSPQLHHTGQEAPVLW